MLRTQASPPTSRWRWLGARLASPKQPHNYNKTPATRTARDRPRPAMATPEHPVRALTPLPLQRRAAAGGSAIFWSASLLNARAAVLQDALGRFINAKLVTEHNDKLELLSDKATHKYRAGQRVQRKHPGKSKKWDHGNVMHVDVHADGKLPTITVLWMMHDGKIEDVRGTIYVDRVDIDKLNNYRANFIRLSLRSAMANVPSPLLLNCLR